MMMYVGPEFYLFYYEPRDKLEDFTFPDGHKVKVTPVGYVKPERVLHRVQINGLTDKKNPNQTVHVHVTSAEGFPEVVNYFEKTDENYETTKIVVEFAKLVAKGIVEIRKGSSPL